MWRAPKQGKTVEVGRAYFETDTRRYTILDAPGHKSFVPSMISGAAQADVAVLVISARKGEFETGFEKGGQTREHAMLVKTAGVQKLVVVVNKMDDPTVNWDKERCVSLFLLARALLSVSTVAFTRPERVWRANVECLRHGQVRRDCRQALAVPQGYRVQPQDGRDLHPGLGLHRRQHQGRRRPQDCSLGRVSLVPVVVSLSLDRPFCYSKASPSRRRGGSTAS